MAEFENGNGNGSMLGGLPVWVRAIATVGAPIAFAAWLIYFMTNGLGAKLDAVYQTQDAHYTQTIEVRQDIQDFLRHHELEITMMKQVLQQICVNGASDKAERDRCFPTK